MFRYSRLKPESSSRPNENIIPLTRYEQIIIGSNAILWGIGTSSLLVEGLWYVGTLGVELAGISAACAITGAGIGMGILTVPIAYGFYKQMMTEANEANIAIKEAFRLHKLKQKKLFFELLRLRSFYKMEEKFDIATNGEIKRTKLIALVNKTYSFLKERKISVSENNSEILGQIRESNANTLSAVLRDTNKIMNSKIRSSIMRGVQAQDNFASILHRCFAPVPKLPKKNKAKAAGWGVISGLTVAGTVLSTGWAFGALVAGGSLCAAIPVIGWCILGIASIALGVMFGLGMGLCKQKNYQRQALAQNIKERNIHLDGAIRRVQQKNFFNALHVQNHKNARLLKQLSAERKRHANLQQQLNKTQAVLKNLTPSVPYRPTTQKCTALRQFSIVSSRSSVASAKTDSKIQKESCHLTAYSRYS